MGLEQLPWEQNERSEINTYVEDVEGTSDIKEQIQTQMDIKNSESTKMETSIVENSKYEKPASNENQKNDNSKLYISEKPGESNISDRKKMVESNNQHLNEAILSSKISEDERNSSIFFDISIPDIVANNERLNTPKGKKNSFTTDNSINMKRSSKDLEKSYLNVNDILNKRSKTSSLNDIKSNDENLTDKNVKISIIDQDAKLSYSRSPSLFDDSLNLDTQICDLLEQNVMNIAPELDSKMFASDLDLVTNTVEKKIASSDVGNAHLQGESDAKNVNTALIQTRNSVLSWDDDSWNNSERLLKQIVQADSDQNSSKKEISKPKIKNIVNTNVFVTPKNIKTCTPNDKESMRKTDIKKRAAIIKEKVPRKPKLPKIAKVESPITNIIVYRNERKMSVESNESDDIIVGSQHFESPFSDNKNRTRTKLEKIRKMRSQKLAENTITEINNHLNSPIRAASSNMADNKTKQKVKPKLQEILERNLLLATNCNIDSVIYNSEDETMLTSVSRTKHETQSNTLNKNIKPKIEAALSDDKTDLPSETVDWNILNIVKVADNRVTFNLFKREVLKKRNIALALHCDNFIDSTNSIGSKICTSDTERKRKSRRSGSYTHRNMEIRGAAISWESNIAYYISFSNSSGNRNM